MTDRPIIFSGPMIEALLAGRKSMTRRLRRTADKRAPGGYRDSPWTWTQSGDRLWVRETWADVNSEEGPALLYRADSAVRPWGHWCAERGPDYGAGPSMNYERYPGNYTMWWSDLLAGEPDHSWRSPIHMPRWASRLTLEVTGVKVERLQDISEEDAMAEGVQKCARRVVGLEGGCDSYVCGFQQVWLSIHGKGAWDTNPDVAVLSFKAHHCNIDQMEKAA